MSHIAHDGELVNGFDHHSHSIPPHLIGEVARKLRGDPNKALSSRSELRFGAHGSLSVDLSKGAFYDHEAKEGGGILDLIARETGAKNGECWEKLEELTGFKPEPRARASKRIVRTYDYIDPAGAVHSQVVRYEPKAFSQRRPDPDRPGEWLWNMKGVEPLPYRLPELIEGIAAERPVFALEGEKDCDTAAGLGIVATCNAGGACKWTAAHATHLRGADVIVVPDNDSAGQRHADKVARSLNGIAKRVRVLLLPDVPPKGDLTKWVEAGGTAAQLWALVDEAPDWMPPADGVAAEQEPAERTSMPTEADLADRFVERYGDALRYVAEWSKWLHYDGQVWRKEPTLLVRDYAKKLCREAAGKADSKDLRSLASGKTIGSVQTLAQAHRRVAATVDQWDADPWLLNTPAGTIDLRTGELSPHSPDDHVTKVTGVEPAENADCPLWLGFLDRIFAGDKDLIAYVQRVLGYSLTGITKEHAMFFAYGTGGNGKSVMLDTVAGIMGDYHTTAPVETFTASMGSRHPTELADLVSARLVTAIETEQGQAWAEARIKSLTGGDRVKARFMRQDFFEFQPQFKLMVAGNHQPVLQTVDEAIKRRFNMLPFEVTIPAEERDPDLTDKLRVEWPAVLRWMLDGCMTWQQQGLQPPKAVTEATGQYLDGQDALGAWLSDCCEESSTFRESASALYGSWKSYAERNGEVAGSQKSFGPQLVARGFRKIRAARANFYQGLRLIAEEPPMPSWPDR